MYVIKIQNGDLVHHGVLGMRWGIRRYQPYSVKGRGSGKKGKEIGDAAKVRKSKEEKKAERRQKKFVKAQTKVLKIKGRYQREAEIAERSLAKAEKKSSSLFSTEKGIKKAYDKAAESQKKANRYAYQGKRAYEKILKKYPDMKMNQKISESGMFFLDQVKRNTESYYISTSTQSIGKKKKNRR